MNDWITIATNFAIYSFIGWIWETIFVSVRKKKVINRGFLYGPWLPIYGLGALLILHVSSPWKDVPSIVFLSGMIGASILEYFTGVIMEYLFHVRYWDYSNQPFNLNGHICLHVSLAWGIASLLLIYLIHPVLITIFTLYPTPHTHFIILILSPLFALDVFFSTLHAVDMRQLLSKLQIKNKLKIQIKNSIQHLQTDFNIKLSSLEEFFVDFHDMSDLTKEKIKTIKEHSIESRIQYYLSKEKEAFELLENQCHSLIHRLKMNSESNQKEIEDLNILLNSIQNLKSAHTSKEKKSLTSTISILQRNPSSISNHYPSAFQQLVSLKKKKDRN